MSHNTPIVSDITYENEASHSSEEEDVRTLEKINELPLEENRTKKDDAIVAQKRKFLEDGDFLNQSNLGTPLLERKSSPTVAGEKRGISLQQFKPRKAKRKIRDSQMHKANADEDNNAKGDSRYNRHSRPTPDISKEKDLDQSDSISLDLNTKKLPADDSQIMKHSKLTGEDEKDDDDDDDDEDDSDEEEGKNNDMMRAKKILRDVFPTFLFSVVQLIQESIVLQFVGHYCGPSEFAAVGKFNFFGRD